jgi:hypothetical protein
VIGLVYLLVSLLKKLGMNDVEFSIERPGASESSGPVEKVPSILKK